ncbi:MAG: NAD(P)-binding protein, partial [Pseudomonadota bacterium]|nr:NAD(P)-binding protein [Pseudomonadota bacterium]
MTSTLTRRHLLEGTLAGLVAGVSIGCADHRSGRKVVVVGAGLSGLNAALILERWGFEVQMVEARERVGGRLWTL